ncbi:unnamed protein product, partial [Didymodactylos carnosus]
QTCYQHLQCNLGDTLLCIGWENICDGIIQCIDGVDEEHCWQLKINQCTDNEYQCRNGQCIPMIFYEDNIKAPDCLDGSDELLPASTVTYDPVGPPFRYNELACLGRAIFYIRHHFESYCSDVYASMIKSLLFWKKPDSMYDICWLALMCYFKDFIEVQVSCADICQYKECQEKIATHCPTMFYMPNASVAFGHIYFAYTKQYIIKQTKVIVHPEYVCYNELFCNGFDSNNTTILFNNKSLSTATHFKCTIGKKIISQKLRVAQTIDCHCGFDEYGLCEDAYYDLNYIREHISFPKVCDGIVDLKPILIDGKNETDETECSQSQWLCNNTYTRCNGIWNCLNGEDETNCYPSSLMNCPQHNHLCLSSDT